jgi:hypothetical protein
MSETSVLSAAGFKKPSDHELVNICRFCNKIDYDNHYPLKYMYTFGLNYIVRHRVGQRHGIGEKAENLIQNRKKGTKYNGAISKPTKTKLLKHLSEWLRSLEFSKYEKINGKKVRKHHPVSITLTLSDIQKHDDNYIKRYMLGRFISVAQKKYGIRYYFWRAEAQRNGNIHFHLVIDKYFSRTDIQKEWNAIQKDYGYLKNFEQKFKHGNPPSTQVQASGVDGCVEYVTKYVSKDEKGKRIIEGRLWGMSDELKKYNYLQMDAIPSLDDMFHYFARKNFFKILCDDFFDILLPRGKAERRMIDRAIKDDLKNHRKHQYEAIYGT